MKMTYSKPISIFIIIIGFMVIGVSFFSYRLELQIALSLAGVGLICSGMLQLGQVENKKKEDERFQQLIAKLDQIKQELEKQVQPKNTGVAIADVISSGLKYYTEHIQKKEEKNDS